MNNPRHPSPKMKRSFISRWTPGVVALRWRHLFWAVPLLGLLTGGGIEWRNYQRSIEARGVIQRQDSATISMTEITGLILSDAVLQETALGSGYLNEWKPDSAAELRHIIRCEEVKGTSLLAITVKGRSNSTKAELCNQLPILMAKKTEEMRNQRIKEAEEELQTLTQGMKEIRARYMGTLKIGAGVPEEPFVPTPEFLDIQREFEESDKALDAARTAYINLRLQGVVSGAPIRIIEKAAAPVAFSVMELVEPLARTSCWAGASILLAVLLAYLLEWRYPRRMNPGIIRRSSSDHAPQVQAL